MISSTFSHLTRCVLGFLTLIGWLFWAMIACYFLLGLLIAGPQSFQGVSSGWFAFLGGVVLLVTVYPILISYGLLQRWSIGTLALVWLAAYSVHWTLMLNTTMTVLNYAGGVGISVVLLRLAYAWERRVRRHGLVKVTTGLAASSSNKASQE